MPKFDLEKTEELYRLFRTHKEFRDESWRKRFYNAVVDASLMALDPRIVIGPDEFPYFQLCMPFPDVEQFSISHVLDAALQNFFGACIYYEHERGENPEWVFSYGDLLSYKLYGSFNGDPNDENLAPSPNLRKEVVAQPRDILIGQPGENYFPLIAQQALGDFLRQRYGFKEPKICLIVDPQLHPARNIAINIDIADLGGKEDNLQAIFQAISWFMPRNYGLMSVPKGLDQSTLKALP